MRQRQTLLGHWGLPGDAGAAIAAPINPATGFVKSLSVQYPTCEAMFRDVRNPPTLISSSVQTLL